MVISWHRLRFEFHISHTQAIMRFCVIDRQMALVKKKEVKNRKIAPSLRFHFCFQDGRFQIQKKIGREKKVSD